MRSQKFGASIRKLYEKAIKDKKSLYKCPKCDKVKVKNAGMGMWFCKSCEANFAGGAYTFRTEAGEISARLVNEYATRG